MQSIIDAILATEKKYIIIPIFYSIISNSGFAFMQLFVKFLRDYITLSQILYIRSIFLFTINYGIIHLSKSNLYIKDTKVFRLILLRMGFQAIVMYAFFIPVKYIPLSILNSVWMTGPLFLYFIQAFLMKTPLNKHDLLITLFSFLGIILIIKPSFLFGNEKQIENMIYCFVTLLGTFLNAVSTVLIRMYKHGIANDANLQYFYFSQAINTSINFLIFQAKTEQVNFDIRFFILLSCFVFIAYLSQMCYTRAVYLISAATVGTFQYLGIIIGLISDVFLFNRSFDYLSILGMIITSSGLLYITFKRK